MKKIIAIVGLLAGALILSGCATVDTQPDTVALRYSGGFSSAQFMNCVDHSTKSYTSPGDNYYYYPFGQRTFTFDNNGEEGPLSIVTKDNVTMTLAGTVTFKLNTDCNTLQKFHENIGIKYNAYFNDNQGANGSDKGWVDMLQIYVGNQIQRAANDAAKGFTSQQLYSDAASKRSFEKAVIEDIPANVKQFSGGDYFIDWSVLLKNAVPPKEIVEAYNAQQAAVAQAAAAKQAADQQVAVENAKALSTTAEIKSIQQLVNVLGVEGYIQYKAIQDGKIAVLPIPQGSNVIVNPKG